MACCMVFLFSSFYLGIVPAVCVRISSILTLHLLIKLQGATLSQATAYNFFTYTLGLWIIIGGTVIYKLVYRTPWRKLEEADLKTGRHVLTPEEIDRLNKYYAMSTWQRFLSYVKPW